MNPLPIPMSPAEATISLPAEPVWGAWLIVFVIVLSMAGFLLATPESRRAPGEALRNAWKTRPTFMRGARGRHCGHRRLGRAA